MNIESFLKCFKNTFSLFMDLYTDEREFLLIPWNSEGYFSAFNNPADHYTFSLVSNPIEK